MRYLLDTNMCIYWFKGIKDVDKKISDIDIDDVAISAITLAELLYGAYNSTKIENIKAFRVFALEAFFIFTAIVQKPERNIMQNTLR